MNVTTRIIVLAGILLLLQSTGNAQVAISLSVSPGTIHKNEYANLRILVENAENIQQVVPPALKKFMIVGGPNQESSITSLNGHTQRTVSLSFIIKPTETGTLKIGSARVTIDGKQYVTNETSLVVKKSLPGSSQSAAPPLAFRDPFAGASRTNEYNDYIFRKGENIADKVARNMELRLETDKTTCYVGEPILATYKLYTRLKSESRLTGNPSFNGFSVVDMTGPDISSFSKQKLNGREYNVYTIRKAQLYPLQAGNILLEPAELENNIQFLREEYGNNQSNDLIDLFDNFSQASIPSRAVINQIATLKSKPRNILVKPLPEANKPASFMGAVGSFSIEAFLARNTFPLNESGKLVIRLSGQGNLQMLTAPPLTWPRGVDAFDPKVSESISKLTVPLTGIKTFEYSFSTNAAGSYQLPPINFSYFDPVIGKYKTITTQAFSFTVTKAPRQVPSQIKLPVSTTVSFYSIIMGYWWVVVILLAVLIALAWFIKKSSQNSNGPTVENKAVATDGKIDEIIHTITDNQQNPLSRTDECLYEEDCEKFYSLLNSELRAFISRKLSLEAALMDTKDIVAALDKKNISNAVVLQLQDLLHEIEWQLYTPFERNEKMNKLYQQAQNIIQLINTRRDQTSVNLYPTPRTE